MKKSVWLFSDNEVNRNKRENEKKWKNMTDLWIQLYVIYFCKEKFFALNLLDIIKNIKLIPWMISIKFR